MMYFLCAILTYYNVCLHGQALLCCDNKSALERVERFVTRYNTNLHLILEFDIQEEFHLVAETLGVELRFEHFQGHQDKGVSYKDLQHNAQINIKKDAEVAEFLTPEPGLDPTPCALHYPANNISLTIAGVRVTKHFQRAAA